VKAFVYFVCCLLRGGGIDVEDLLTKTTAGRAMAQIVLRRRFTTEPGVPSRPPYVGYPVDRVAPGQVFLRVLVSVPVTVVPPILNTHLFTYRLCSVTFCNWQRRQITQKDERLNEVTYLRRVSAVEWLQYFCAWSQFTRHRFVWHRSLQMKLSCSSSRIRVSMPCLSHRKERKLNAGNESAVSEFKISSFQNTSAVALYPLVKIPFTFDLVDIS